MPAGCGVRDRWNILINLLYAGLGIGFMFLLRELAEVIALTLGLAGLAFRLARAAGLFLGILLGIVLGGAILLRWRYAPCVYRAARRHGHDLCPRCGYWLHELADDITRCPECGAKREASDEDGP